MLECVASKLYFVNSVFFECNANESFMNLGPQED